MSEQEKADLHIVTYDFSDYLSTQAGDGDGIVDKLMRLADSIREGRLYPKKIRLEYYKKSQRKIGIVLEAPPTECQVMREKIGSDVIGKSLCPKARIQIFGPDGCPLSNIRPSLAPEDTLRSPVVANASLFQAPEDPKVVRFPGRGRSAFIPRS
jgi:hypothetical protein